MKTDTDSFSIPKFKVVASLLYLEESVSDIAMATGLSDDDVKKFATHMAQFLS